MLGVVGELLLAAAARLGKRTLHRVGHAVGIEDRPAVEVSSGSADRLDERALAAQEALLVRVENGDERNLGNVEALTKQVDAHEHVEPARAQVADDLDALDGIDVRVEVPHAHAVLGKEVREVLGHALCERRHEHALLLLHGERDLGEQVIDLGDGGTHLDPGVDEARRTHDLLNHLARTLLELVGCGRRRDEDAAAHLALELVEAERAVVERGRKTEAVVDERLLARAVAAVHAAELSHHHVALVEEHDAVGREVVDETGRRLAGRKAREVAGVVFNALAEAHLIEHLQIEHRALLQALRLYDAPVGIELGETLLELGLDARHGTYDLLAGRDVVACGVHDEAGHLLLDAAGERIEEMHGLDFVVEELDAYGALGMFCGEDVDRVAANAECAAHEVRVGAAVLHLDELRDEPALVLPVALAKDEPHLGVALGLADAVDRRDGGDDDRVAALENGLGGGKTHLLDVLVDGRVLLDEEVACGDVGLGLVEVVVGDEVLDGVLREEVAHFSVGLRGERLVGRHDEGGDAEPRDDVRHRVGLARTRHAEQRLEHDAVLKPLGERLDGRGLIARRRKGLVKDEGRVGISDDLCHWKPRSGI